ncbi:MAG: hypothetical protein AB7S80_18525, partial [Rhizobiaceae bacterium]
TGATVSDAEMSTIHPALDGRDEAAVNIGENAALQSPDDGRIQRGHLQAIEIRSVSRFSPQFTCFCPRPVAAARVGDLSAIVGAM